MKKTIIPLALTILTGFLFACTGPAQNTENSNISSNNQQSMKLTPENNDTVAVLNTNLGAIKMLLYEDKAPKTVDNFKKLAEEGKYNNVIFHRVIKNFMVQTGDFENKDGTGGYSCQGPGTVIEDEFGEGLEHVYGAVSMANRGPNTGGSQFFIVQAPQGTPWLDGKHAIFGYIYEGMDIVEKIANTETNGEDRPLEDIKIENIEIESF